MLIKYKIGWGLWKSDTWSMEIGVAGAFSHPVEKFTLMLFFKCSFYMSIENPDFVSNILYTSPVTSVD